MVNSQVTREISNAFKIDERVTKLPAAIPVVEVGVKSVKELNVVKTLLCHNAASTTLYTTPENEDFYLLGGSMSLKISSGTESSTEFYITCVISGVRTNILGHAAASNAYQTVLPVYFMSNHPIKVDKNTTITVTMNAPAAGDRAMASIYGYKDEVI